MKLESIKSRRSPVGIWETYRSITGSSSIMGILMAKVNQFQLDNVIDSAFSVSVSRL